MADAQPDLLPEPPFVPKNSGFGIYNLPFCTFSQLPSAIAAQGSALRSKIGCRIGDWIINIDQLSHQPGNPLFQNVQSENDSSLWRSRAQDALRQPTLNAFADLGVDARRYLRKSLQSLLIPKEDLVGTEERKTAEPYLHQGGPCMVPLDQVELHMPFEIGDYTDFYAGIHHATNVGRLFRPQGNALQENYLHLPVGYHGRASSVVISGTPVRRPRGQIITGETRDKKLIKTLPSRKLDYEVELGCFISGPSNPLGVPVSMNSPEIDSSTSPDTSSTTPSLCAADRIFGYVLLNDWSARDIQAFEYVPLGPFNGKNFCTSISPYVVTPEALEFALGPGVPHPDPSILQPYLREHIPSMLRMDISTSITKPVPSQQGHETTKQISAVQASDALLWSFPQMIAHHTIGGCPLRAGDLLGSGTISGPPSYQVGGAPEVETRGSLLEVTKNGKEPLIWGTERGDGSADTEKDSGEENGGGLVTTFLEDGDVVTMTGEADYRGRKISFGEVVGKVMPLA